MRRPSLTQPSRWWFRVLFSREEQNSQRTKNTLDDSERALKFRGYGVSGVVALTVSASESGPLFPSSEPGGLEHASSQPTSNIWAMSLLCAAPLLHSEQPIFQLLQFQPFVL